MMKSFPVTSVPNTQSYPEMGFPAAAYYGIEASLQEQRAFSASGNSGSGLAPSAQSASPRTLVTIIVVVLLAGLAWHWYYRK